MDDGRLEGYRLIHIRDNIAKATLFIMRMSYEQLRDDAKSFYAVTRTLEIISGLRGGCRPN